MILALDRAALRRQPNTQMTGSSPWSTTLVRHRRRIQRVLKKYVLERRHLHQIKLQPPLKRQDLVAGKWHLL